MFKIKKKYKIFVTRPIPEAGIRLLQNNFFVTVRKSTEIISRSELDAAASKHDAILCLLTDHIDGAFLKKHKHLLAIANYAVGFDNINVDVATHLGIPVMNTPDVLDDAVAEHTFALLFAVSRHVVEADAFTRAGKYTGWQPLMYLGAQLFGKTLGIVGLGRIGMGVAKRAAQGFNMHILYTNLRPDPVFERHYNAKFVSFEKLLKESDFVSLHVPLLPSTTHLMDAKQLKMMKKTAYLINTSRGPVVNEKALYKALKKHQIAGAGIDVFEREPKLTPGLNRLDNIVMTPHIASATVEARTAMSVLAAQGLVDTLSRRKPDHLVDLAVWKHYLTRLK